jgi:hypothetical protein
MMVCVVYVWKKIINNMIVVIMIMIGITLIVSSIIEWNKDMNRIQELENRLDEHYKEREKRLKDKGLIK